MLLDHVTTYADVDELGAHLEAYRAAGFPVDDRIVAHANGARSGVIRFGAEYLELLAVEDVETFAATAPKNDQLVCVAHRPFGLGLKTSGLDELRATWSAHGLALPDVAILRAEEAGSGEPVAWRILQIPLTALRGASCFVTEKDDHAALPPSAPNGTYALAAVTMVSAEAAVRAAQWQALLAPGADELAARGDAPIALAHHRVFWITPDAYRARFARTWEAARHPLGEIAVVHLVTEDLARTEAHLTAARRAWTAGLPAAAAIFVEPDPRDGLALAIHACPRAQWDAWRRERRGPGLDYGG